MYRWFDAGLLEQPLESRRHPLDIVRRPIVRGHAMVVRHVRRSPTVRDRATDVVLAEHVGERQAGFGLVENGDNLCFGKSGLPYGASKCTPKV